MNFLTGHDDKIPGLKRTFDALPVDPYTEGDFRFRRYSTFRYVGGTVEPLPPETFMQSSDINTFLGDVERAYEPVAEQTWRDPAFAQMFALFDEHTTIAIGNHIGVHQIRIYKKEGSAMAPEGRHQDGFDRIAVFMVENVNITGGHIRLSRTSTEEAFFDRELIPGDYIVLNDRAVFHNASPIDKIDDSKEGYVDLFVLTSSEDEPT